jgi:glycosyltransferase involved in cell wall biosynthesis
MIFDFDDAIYTHDFYKTKTLTRMADAVIVCSRTLATWARQFNKNVHIIHTSLTFSAYERFTKNYSLSREPVVIGWVGTAKDHYKNLQFLVAVLEKLVKTTRIPFKFVLVGAEQNKKVHDLFKSLDDLEVEIVDSLDWSNAESVPRTIQKFDIGVMPLVGTGEWNLARSSFKPLEYMACGVATVSSAIGEITHVIQDGVNGYLAEDEDDWVSKLGRLLADRELCATIGKAGQAYMRANDSYEVIIPDMIKLINSLSGSTIGP